jgi:hypothetical protein
MIIFLLANFFGYFIIFGCMIFVCYCIIFGELLGSRVVAGPISASPAKYQSPRIEQPWNDHLMPGFALHFCRRAHCLWCSKNRWSPPLGAIGASIVVKIVKIVENELKAKKLWASKVENRFYKKF